MTNQEWLQQNNAKIEAMQAKLDAKLIAYNVDEEITAQEVLLADLKTQVDNLDEINLGGATATESDVLAGKTFFSGDAEIKTGTLEVPDLSATTATTDDVLQGKKFYNAQGEFVEGIYTPPTSTDNKLSQVLNGDAITLTASDLAGVTAIRQQAFNKYPNELNITIPSSVTDIGMYAFYDSKLKELKFEENSQLKTIGVMSFHNTDITSVTIPKSVTTMGSDAFSFCYDITSLTFEQGCLITEIPSSAFQNSCNIDMLDLSTCIQLTKIGNNAFSSSTIRNMILPSSLTSIGSSAMPGSLDTLTVLATTPPTLNANFAQRLATIYIPAGTLSAYQSATNWSKYSAKFVELEV